MTRVRAQRNGYFRKYNRKRKKSIEVIAVDGEGVTTADGQHLYVYVAAWTEDRMVGELEDRGGLKTRHVLDWLLSLAGDGRLIAGFSLGYDYTKMLEGLPNDKLFRLVRPELRRGKKRMRPVLWDGFKLNYVRARLDVSRGKRSVTLWDVWAFFQGSFVDACQKWGVTTPEEHEYLKAMKAGRSEFNLDTWDEVKKYCGFECRKLAKMVDMMRKAHIDAGLPLQSYYGAGSTASALLKKMSVKDYMPVELPEAVKQAVKYAFFGGRFEISRFGQVTEDIHSYDIASAYPYQLYHLPCMACGKWEHVTTNVDNCVERASLSLVRYWLPKTEAFDYVGDACSANWGPFPLRCKGLEIDDGSIIYPATSGGGWLYGDEYLTGRDGWPNVEPLEAWCYTTECKHRPFDYLSEAYRERLRWGKDGRGIVLKLGPNSCYGKLAQSVGDKPPYQCFLWAGACTSGCRAQLLRMIMQGSVLMTATDGIASRDILVPPRARDTGTAAIAREYGKEALGSWEHKTVPGLHLIRPGIAFPLGSTDERETKARGVGKSTVAKYRQMILESWATHGPKAITVQGTLFRGMKSCTSYCQEEFRRHKEYGTWKLRDTQVSYWAEPKRPMLMHDDGTLYTWAFDKEVTSAAYDRITTAEGRAMRKRELLQAEQPDRTELEDAF